MGLIVPPGGSWLGRVTMRELAAGGYDKVETALEGFADAASLERNAVLDVCGCEEPCRKRG
jgi:hypothetical protein